jgi:hypothetical protein
VGVCSERVCVTYRSRVGSFGRHATTAARVCLAVAVACLAALSLQPQPEVGVSVLATMQARAYWRADQLAQPLNVLLSMPWEELSTLVASWDAHVLTVACAVRPASWGGLAACDETGAAAAAAQQGHGAPLPWLSAPL